MKFLEKDLEDIIWESDKIKLSERGLSINGKLLRQVKIGNYGIADLIEYRRPRYSVEYSHHFTGSITVYELKKDNVSVSSYFQAVRYKKGIQRYLEKKGIDGGYDIDICLIGRDMDDSSSIKFLPDVTGDVTIFSYKYGIEGLEFKSISDYRLIDEGF